ncbi:MAG: hypothetical protein Q7U04_06805 [Bacteriovorax sp.]|nr:hypothetical protein [Bacteriovorax sp.]
MKKFLIFAIAIFSYSALAEDNERVLVNGKETTIGNKKIVYTYKQFEKFDFDDLNIEGDTGSPGDLSISPIHEKRFTNRLPYRKSFTVEIKKGIERVR